MTYQAPKTVVSRYRAHMTHKLGSALRIIKCALWMCDQPDVLETGRPDGNPPRLKRRLEALRKELLRTEEALRGAHGQAMLATDKEARESRNKRSRDRRSRLKQEAQAQAQAQVGDAEGPAD